MRAKLKQALTIWLGMCASSALFAATTESLQAYAAEPQWRALLHFPKSSTGPSYVDDPRFFLAETGRSSPLSELTETLAAFSAEPSLRCRYPAREQWLVEKKLLAPAAQHCDEYRQWRDKLNVDAVVLVLASSYLNSPSSMYGHTFLRLDPAGERGDSDFLSYALNFGANIPPGENDLLYAYRGLFGGYPGLFSMQPYYQKIQEYTRLENRDMWEYRLTLADEEIDRLLSHVWELRNVNFDYFFFDENCSYRLLELLEVARPGLDLTSPFEYAAMPVDTVREVVDAGLVGQIDYRPSKRLELDTLTAALSAEERVWVRQLADGDREDLADTGLDADAKRATYLAAYRYLRYRLNTAPRTTEMAARSLRLLRGARKPGGFSAPVVSTPPRPERGHRTSMFGLGVGYREFSEQGPAGNEALEYVDLDWRISYHDALDAMAGYPEGASLVMGNLALRWQDQEGVRLQRFDLVDIRSLSPRGEFFSPISWQVQLGLERLDDAPNQPLVAQINASGGGTWSVMRGVAYLMPALRFEYNADFREDWRLAPGINIGQLWQGTKYSAELAGQWQDFSGAGERKVLKVSGNYAWSADSSLRLSIDYRDQPWGHSHGVALSWRQHF